MSESPATAADPVSRCHAALTRQWPEFTTMAKLPPATDEQLLTLSTAIKHPLPALLADWLRVVNGENIGVVLASGWTFLSTDEVAMHWGFFADARNQMAPAVQFTDHPHRVTMPPDHARRIPVAADYSGNLLVIDSNPADAAMAGQVLLFMRESGNGTHVVFNSFADLLNAVADEIEQGRVETADGGVRFTANTGMLRPWFIRARQFRSVPWAPTAEQHAFVSTLDDGWRSACYLGQNDLLATDPFGADDLDLVRTIVLAPEQMAQAANLLSFPYLHSVRIGCDADPVCFAAMAALDIKSLTITPTSAEGLAGLGAMAGNTTVEQLNVSMVDQASFDAATSMTGLRDLTAIASHVDDISSIERLPTLATFHLSGTGQPDMAPAYNHPTLKHIVLMVDR
jgi:cell wall assembly regulator SMI1